MKLTPRPLLSRMRTWLLLLSVVAVVMAFTGLLRPKLKQPRVSIKEPAGQILLWHSLDGEEARFLKDIIARFEALYSNIRVLDFYYPDTDIPARFTERSSYGLAPDAVLAPNLVTQLLDADELLDISSTKLLDDLKPQALHTVRKGEQLLGLPITVETQVLYYNTDRVSEPVSNTSDLLLQAQAGKVVAIPTNFFDATWGITAFGGTIHDGVGNIALNQGGIISWLRWLLELQSIPNVILSPDKNELIKLFQEGKVAYLVASIADLSDLQSVLGEKVQTTKLPSGPVGPSQPLLRSEVLALGRHSSANQEAATLAFAEFLSAPQQQRRFMLELARVPSSLVVGIDQFTQNALHIARLQSFETVPFLGDQLDRALLSGIGDEIYMRVLAGVITRQEALDLLTDISMDQNSLISNARVPSFTMLLPSLDSLSIAATSTQNWTPSVLFGTMIHGLGRPAVQVQLWSLLAAGLISILITTPLAHVMTQRFRGSLVHLPKERWGLFRRSMRLARILLLPTFLLLGFWVLQFGLTTSGHASGVIQSALAAAGVFWLYRLASHGVKLRLPSRQIRPYRIRLLLPALLMALLLLGFSTFVPFSELLTLQFDSAFDTNITLGVVLLVTVGLYFWIEGTLVFEKVVRHLLTQRFHSVGALEVMIILSRYLGIIAGVALALRLIGMNTTTLGFIWGGLSVGIGFSLRGILSNFMSGLILLFEQSIRPGDVIEIESGTRAVVTKVNIRATEARTYTGAEIIIPNEILLTSRVTNYSHSDRKIRLEVEVAVDYGTDLKHALQVLRRVSNSQPWILRDPEPVALIRSFDDSGISLALLAWVNDLAFLRRSDLALAIWEAFQEEGILMPFPQRDLHIKSDLLNNLINKSPDDS